MIDNAFKQRVLNAADNIFSRLVAKIRAQEEGQITVIADTMLDKRYMDVTETKVYLLPLANTVSAGTRKVIRHPDRYAATTNPTIQASGADVIYYGGGNSTSMLLDQNVAVEVVLVSDGVSSWGL